MERTSTLSGPRRWGAIKRLSNCLQKGALLHRLQSSPALGLRATRRRNFVSWNLNLPITLRYSFSSLHHGVQLLSGFRPHHPYHFTDSRCGKLNSWQSANTATSGQRFLLELHMYTEKYHSWDPQPSRGLLLLSPYAVVNVTTKDSGEGVWWVCSRIANSTETPISGSA